MSAGRCVLLLNHILDEAPLSIQDGDGMGRSDRTEHRWK